MKVYRRGDRKRDPRGQVTFGLFLIVAGAAMVLDHLGIVQIGSISSWWPFLVMAIGVGKILTPEPGRDVPEGAMFILLAVWFLGCVHHWYGLTWRNSWPLVFVALGTKTVLQAIAPRSPKSAPGQEEFHA